MKYQRVDTENAVLDTEGPRAAAPSEPVERGCHGQAEGLQTGAGVCVEGDPQCAGLRLAVPPAQEGLAQGIPCGFPLHSFQPMAEVVMGLSPSAEAGAHFVPQNPLTDTGSSRPELRPSSSSLGSGDLVHRLSQTPTERSGRDSGVGALHLPAEALGCTVPGPGRQT